MGKNFIRQSKKFENLSVYLILKDNNVLAKVWVSKGKKEWVINLIPLDDDGDHMETIVRKTDQSFYTNEHKRISEALKGVVFHPECTTQAPFPDSDYYWGEYLSKQGYRLVECF